MDSGFTKAQFDLLARYGGQPAPDGTEGPAYRALRDAHYATRDWADALCARLFPNGRVEDRRAPINQGGNVQP